MQNSLSLWFMGKGHGFFSSSNLRELKNLVDTLLKMKAEGRLKGVEIFVFTDNSTAERAFFKGSSKSRLLHDLVLELR